MATKNKNSPALRQGVDFRGTPNATEKVTEHVPPGRKRAPLPRYIRINLPRTTRVLMLLVVAVVGVASTTVALSDYEPFTFANPILWGIVGATVVFVVVGAATKIRIWTAGLAVVTSALLVYVGGLWGNEPYVWNGASIVLAATWNIILLASLAYLVLYWALRYGMIVAAPDNQDFMD